jgi:hypothetical protein
MSAFLTIAGTAYAVDQQGASEGPRDYAGSLRRAFDLTMRNMTRAAKRSWTVTLAPMSQAQWETLDALTSLRQPVTLDGTMFGVSSPITCHLTATGVPFLAADLSHLRTVILTLQES